MTRKKSLRIRDWVTILILETNLKTKKTKKKATTKKNPTSTTHLKKKMNKDYKMGNLLKKYMCPKHYFKCVTRLAKGYCISTTEGFLELGKQNP